MRYNIGVADLHTVRCATNKKVLHEITGIYDGVWLNYMQLTDREMWIWIKQCRDWSDKVEYIPRIIQMDCILF